MLSSKSLIEHFESGKRQRRREARNCRANPTPVRLDDGLGNARAICEYKFGGFAEAFGSCRPARSSHRSRTITPNGSTSSNRVVVDLTTDDAGGISALDFALGCPFAVALAFAVTVLFVISPAVAGGGP
jgi:hypothetical protein